MTKKEARIFALEKRKFTDLTLESIEAVEKIVNEDYLKNCKRVALYYPLKNELSVLDLLNIYEQKEFFLPKTKDCLEFGSYKNNDILVEGPYDTKEPVTPSVDISSLDAIIIPCLAISNTGKRLGYGKGYYDRALENYKGLKIGICCKSLKYIEIDMNSFDVKLDLVI